MPNAKPKVKSRAEIMADRIRAGRCDCCDGPTKRVLLNDVERVLCYNDGSCGWHEVGKKDGATFVAPRTTAQRIASGGV